MKKVLCIRPCFNVDDGKSRITVGKVYDVTSKGSFHFCIKNDIGVEHMFSNIGNDWDSDPDYFEELSGGADYSYYYGRFRGKCKELCEELMKEFPDQLTLKRGWFHEPSWPRKDEHWWLEDNHGKIHDPTALQFPSKGANYFKNDLRVVGVYEVFDGYANCEECGKRVPESKIIMNGRFPCCSESCALRLVGL